MELQGNTAGLLVITLYLLSRQRWFFKFLHPDCLRTLDLTPVDAFLDKMFADLVDREVNLYHDTPYGACWSWILLATLYHSCWKTGAFESCLVLCT